MALRILAIVTLLSACSTSFTVPTLPADGHGSSDEGTANLIGAGLADGSADGSAVADGSSGQGGEGAEHAKE